MSNSAKSSFWTAIATVLIIATLTLISPTTGAPTYNQQSSQQPPPPVQGGGKPIEGAGVTNGEPDKSPPPNPAGSCSDVPPADLCRLAPQAQADFARLTQQVGVDRQIIQNFGFDVTVEDLERWEQYTIDSQKHVVKEATSLVLGVAWSKVVSKATELAPRMTYTQAASLYKEFEKPAPAVASQLGQAIDATKARGDSFVRLDNFTTKFAEGARDVNKALKAVPTEEGAREILDNTLSAAQLIYPPAAPALEFIKRTISLGYLTVSTYKSGKGILELSRLIEVPGDKLSQLPKYLEQLKKDVDGLKRVNCILKAASALNCSLNAEPPRDHGTAKAVGALAVAGGAAAGAAVALKKQSQSGGGTCVSARNCIVSVLGGGCSCSQSTATGPCNWTGAVAQAGQSCGASVPCAQGLSCNNGRCEGPTGRCPF